MIQIIIDPYFPQDVNALLSAMLRKDLAERGVVIRDENKRQYVRMIG
ncbi:CysS/YqeB C-terminal domain-containing protein [Cytobacillus gottheilii]